jgi:hypothetical protein
MHEDDSPELKEVDKILKEALEVDGSLMFSFLVFIECGYGLTISVLFSCAPVNLRSQRSL